MKDASDFYEELVWQHYLYLSQSSCHKNIFAQKLITCKHEEGLFSYLAAEGVLHQTVGNTGGAAKWVAFSARNPKDINHTSLGNIKNIDSFVYPPFAKNRSKYRVQEAIPFFHKPESLPNSCATRLLSKIIIWNFRNHFCLLKAVLDRVYEITSLLLRVYFLCQCEGADQSMYGFD